MTITCTAHRSLPTALLLVVVAACSCAAPSAAVREAPPAEPAQGPTSIEEDQAAVTEARALLLAGDPEGALARLAPLVEPSLRADAPPEARFLAGAALFARVCRELGACEGPAPRGMGFLEGRQEADLATAHRHLVAAGDAAPAAPFAAEAYFLAGRTLDYGFLQRFDEAIALYRWCFTFYPDSEAGRRAKVRHDDLRSKFGGTGGRGGAHGGD